MRVLVVDDEPGIREGCRRALTPQGFEVEVAENGPSGLHKLQEGVFDILLLDAMMPGMSGLEMLHHVRELYPEIICIMITGYATVELAVQAMRDGAQDFIAKPFTPGLLLEVMNRELDHQRLRREAQRVKNLEEEIRGLTRVRAEMEKLATVESRFMLTMVHVLRAPVAILQNSVQLIQKGYVPPEELPQVLERANLRAGELLATLDDILLLSRLKERVGAKPTETVSLAEVLDSVKSSLQKEVEERQLIVSTEVVDCPVLLGNPDHFRLLWSQLLSNAIQYTPQGGRITLSLNTDSHKRQIQGTVSDSGIGIATEEIPRIFEVFYRSEAAKSVKETGTGLGLPIVQQILSLYGGTIEIDSTPGKGSSIRFTLPQSNLQGGEVP
ncbi:MAG TPA: hybrid sensor histidine kinase/response regulator [Thermodesulfobacteriota bacterium]|nr:hybrid sensor histidine kinase/response regulator [Thermodesulfobacteriota bacterium]